VVELGEDVLLEGGGVHGCFGNKKRGGKPWR